MSSPSKCTYRVYDQISCTSADGLWMTFYPNSLSGECFVNGMTNHPPDTCFDTELCPEFVNNYVDNNYTNYGFCKSMEVCHAPNLTQEDCKLRSLRHERAFECREFVFIDIREKRQSVMIKRYIQVEILNLSNLSKFSNLLSNRNKSK